MDGYANAVESPVINENYQKYAYVQELYENQVRIDKEIAQLSSEIESLPQIPPSMDGWISSFRSNVKISDVTKVFKINRKYKKLIEERKSNGSKIKIFAIDHILDQIDEVTNEKPFK